MEKHLPFKIMLDNHLQTTFCLLCLLLYFIYQISSGKKSLIIVQAKARAADKDFIDGLLKAANPISLPKDTIKRFIDIRVK